MSAEGIIDMPVECAIDMFPYLLGRSQAVPADPDQVLKTCGQDCGEGADRHTCKLPDAFISIVNDKAGWALLDEYLHSMPEDPDTHLSSAAYLMHTCRKGLWLYKVDGKNGFAFVGKHPNEDESWLVFPPPSLVDVEFISEVCALLPEASGRIRVARIKEEHVPLFMDRPEFQWVEELVLDWRFDCLVLSCKKLYESEGSSLKRFRFDKHFLNEKYVVSKVVSAEDTASVDKVNSLLGSWAESVSGQKQFSVDNLIEPNMSGLQMAIEPHVPVTGVLLTYHDDPIGFYVYENPGHGRKSAAGVSMAVNRSVKGASEYCYWDVARHGLKLGFEEVNINGAETESLDAFRRKLYGGLSRRYKIHSFDYVAQ
jgi:hypothetical protein